MVGDSKPHMTPARVLSDDGDSILYAVQLSHGAEVALVLKTALELDLLEIIAEAGPGVHISPSEIARRLAAKNPNAPVMLDRIMRLLAVYSILSCEERDLPDGRVERLYGLAPVCKYFIKNEDGVSLAMSCHLNQDRIALECWSHMKDAILEGGIPFERAHGKPTFVYAVTDPRVNTMVNKAMHHQSIFAMKKILETYTGFEDLKSLVDVGGGIGIVLNMIVSKYPSIHGINYDLPHVIAQAPSYPGVEHIGGDMFVSVPKAEAIFMKWVCHDWSDEDCVKLLKNCYDAVPADGKVMVCDLLLPQRLDTSLVTKNVVHLDVLMLAYNGGGKERTEEEFRALAKAAGFKGFRSVPSGALTCSVMEFLKN